MRKRTKARECALKILYQSDITGKAISAVFEEFIRSEELSDQEILDFCRSLALGVETHLQDINQKVSGYATNWQLKRMAVIDRNILRLGVFELKYTTDIPPKATINEAVELAKKYGDLNSSKFVNGILDKIHKEEAPPVSPLPHQADKPVES